MLGSRKEEGGTCGDGAGAGEQGGGGGGILGLWATHPDKS
jgi:hypothetical protein